MIPDAVLARYRGKGVLVDANLLVLYVVGTYDPREIARHKRTRQFTQGDFELLARVLDSFDRVVTTPYVLAEVGNLAAQIGDHARRGVFTALAEVIPELKEEHVPSAELVRTPSFTRFGLTDSSVMHHAKERFLVLSDDFRLTQYLEHHGVDAINFNHLRARLLG